MIELIKKYFVDRNFSFGDADSDIKPNEISFPTNSELTQKLKHHTFVFHSDKSSNPSFYLFTIEINDDELFEIKKYLWNKNEAELYFITKPNWKNDFDLILYFALTNPREKCINIATFSGRDTETFDKINKWTFSSGAFWLYFNDKLNQIKKFRKHRVDRLLINRLALLKDELKNVIGENNEKVIQALIDRTLFIKFLEDRLIFNGWFYEKYFGNAELNYKEILKSKNLDKVNRLFELVNSIFNNSLFVEPHISNLDSIVFDIIINALSINDKNIKQLSLFDFRFDIIPVEFISHIYEVFLEPKQRENGIYYTPKSLVEIIIEQTIEKPGKILDPACGSGIFLVFAFRKLLELKESPNFGNDIGEKINYRNQLIKDYIFGIEKEEIAHRISLFSLYLEMLRDIDPEEIKSYIKIKLTQLNPNENLNLFPCKIDSNIINANSLEISNPLGNQKFDYIIGNPPFLQISDDLKFQTENNFIAKYSYNSDEIKYSAKNIIEYKQISQCFILRLIEWGHEKTIIGLVSNTSNFYSDEYYKSIKFQDFFFKKFNLLKFYELTEVKKYLFEKAEEGVCIIIFNCDLRPGKSFDYLKVETHFLTEIFNILVLNEDKMIRLSIDNLIQKRDYLRFYQIGNKWDREILKSLLDLEILEKLLTIQRDNSFLGLLRIKKVNLCDYFHISVDSYNKKSKKEQDELHNQFALENFKKIERIDNSLDFLLEKPENIVPYKIVKFDGFINESDVNEKNFQRPRNLNIYKGNKILFNRFGNKISACFVNYSVFFSHYIFSIKLNNNDYYYLITALLNSTLIRYFIELSRRKRIDNNFSYISIPDVKSIPLPKKFDKYIIHKINLLVEEIMNNNQPESDELILKINNYIFDLYDLNILDRKRIIDFFANDYEADETVLELYKSTLNEILSFHLSEKINIEYKIGRNLPFNRNVFAITINNEPIPDLSKIDIYLAKEMLSNIKDNDQIFLRDIIYGNDIIIILKENKLKNWTETKAFEDGMEILERFGI